MDSLQTPRIPYVPGSFFVSTGIKLVQRIHQSKQYVQVIETSMRGDESIRKAVKLTSILDSKGQLRDMSDFYKEVTIMEHIRKHSDHPNIMKLDGFVRCQDFFALWMPLCRKGSLNRLSSGNLLSQTQVERFFVQTACALRYLHKNNILHGDVKPSNILVDASDNALLADFDHARIVPAGQPLTSKWTGTPGFIGPEYAYQKFVNVFLVSHLIYIKRECLCVCVCVCVCLSVCCNQFSRKG